MFSHELTKELLEYYLDIAGYDGPNVRVFTKPSEFDRACKSQKVRPRTWNERHSLAVSLHSVPKPGTWFNLPEHDTLDELQDTAAHEAVHHRWPGMGHGRLFDVRVVAVRGGNICGPRGTRLPGGYKLNEGRQTTEPAVSQGTNAGGLHEGSRSPDSEQTPIEDTD